MPGSEDVEHPAPPPSLGHLLFSSPRDSVMLPAQAQRAHHAPSPGLSTALPAVFLAPSRSQEYGTGPGKRWMASANGELRVPGAGMVTFRKVDSCNQVVPNTLIMAQENLFL